MINELLQAQWQQQQHFIYFIHLQIFIWCSVLLFYCFLKLCHACNILVPKCSKLYIFHDILLNFCYLYLIWRKVICYSMYSQSRCERKGKWAQRGGRWGTAPPCVVLCIGATLAALPLLGNFFSWCSSKWSWVVLISS